MVSNINILVLSYLRPPDQGLSGSFSIVLTSWWQILSECVCFGAGLLVYTGFVELLSREQLWKQCRDSSKVKRCQTPWSSEELQSSVIISFYTFHIHPSCLMRVCFLSLITWSLCWTGLCVAPLRWYRSSAMFWNSGRTVPPLSTPTPRALISL